jgi:hypothetical protein
MSEGNGWNIDETPSYAATVAVSVNGELRDDINGSEKLGDVVQRYAKVAGIHTAAVYSGDRKLSSSDGNRTLAELGLTSLDIRTKDARATR